MIIVPGPASQKLGRKIAELLKQKIVPIEFKRFPDGESYIRFDGEVENEDVVMVQTTSPPQNENLVQLLLMADTKIFTVNSHNPAILKTLQIPIEDLSAIPLLAEHFKNKGFNGAFSLALGKKGLATAVEAAKILEGGYG